MSGYAITERLHESERSVVERALRVSDGRAVILKALHEGRTDPIHLARFARELEMAQAARGEGVVEALGIERVGGATVIVFGDQGGESLDRLLAAGPLDVALLLRCGVRIAKALARVHAARIIHKDVSPANVVYNSETDTLSLIDFGISTDLARERPEASAPSVLEGTLAYISPEQTGRMNRGVDYRSDLYSLGATLFHLATGRPPFDGADALELVHSHLARLPESPSALRAELPEMLSATILKLLAKTAEERYQSAEGAAADLARILEDHRRGAPREFALGERDTSDRFQIPERLHGREGEVETLLAAFGRASLGTAEVVLVPGPAGIGKSSVIHEVHKPISGRRGRLASGKFDQYRRDRPYSAVVDALRGLVRSILTEGDDEVAAVRLALLAAFGPNGRVAIELAPEIEILVGPQPEPPRLSAIEVQNRFYLIMRRLVGALATEGHPLVLVLDDLQWADASSLQVVEALATDPELHHFLLVCAYRDDEAREGAVALTLEVLCRLGERVSSLTLLPLGAEAAASLVAETLHTTTALAAPLARLCLEKTAGNPFFLGQFLASLNDAGHFRFERASGTFRFDLDEVARAGITDNVVALMTTKLGRLPDATQRALRIAACIGGAFDLTTLAASLDAARTDAAATLHPALLQGVVVPGSRDYQFVTDDEAQVIPYRFVHDRVRQAAYALLSDDERPRAHFRIGQLLQKRSDADGRLFEIASHFDLGCALATSEAERDELAALHLRAGERAIGSAAYAPALRFLKAGLGLLGQDASAGARYPLWLALSTGAVRAAEGAGELSEMQQLAAATLPKVKTLLDEVPILEVQIRADIRRGRNREGLASGLALLSRLGVKLPRAPHKGHAMAALLRTKVLLAGRSVESLAALAPMTDDRARSAMRLMVGLASSVHGVAPDLLPLLVCEQVRLSATLGTAPESAFAYAAYGFILTVFMREVSRGERFGQLALDLSLRPEMRSVRARTVCIVYVFIAHWSRPQRESLAPLLEAYRVGLDTGDFEYAFNSALAYVGYAYSAGMPLGEIDSAATLFMSAMRRFGNPASLRRIELFTQAVQNLMGRAKDPRLLIGEVCDERVSVADNRDSADGYLDALVATRKHLLCYWFRDYAAAREHAAVIERLRPQLAGTDDLPYVEFYIALTELALYDELGWIDRKKALFRAEVARRRLARWASDGPESYAHKVVLIDAELARVRGKSGAARELYDEAIALARQNLFIQDEALACELCARFYAGLAKPRLVEVYLRDAKSAYATWGATAKLRDLDEQFPAAASPPVSGGQTTKPSTTSSSRSDAIDLLSVMKASQAISDEIVLQDLLQKLMRVLLEVGGAERGALLIEGDAPRVVTLAHGAGDVEVSEAPAAERGDLAASVVRYVQRTREAVVLDEATHDPRFGRDPYVLRAKPRSVLCAPIVHGQRLAAVVYLENNLAAGAFTEQRRQTLEQLSTQAAISIQNALLYDTLEQRVELRTEELSRALARLKETQQQLVLREKLASLGALTAGIAHEIKNPLNFINNFAGLAVQLTDELSETLGSHAAALDPESGAEVHELIRDLRVSAQKIYDHGKRADGIVTSMLAHARPAAGSIDEVDINALVEEYAQMTIHEHAARYREGAQAPDFSLDPEAGRARVLREDIGRVVVNLVDNALYAMRARKQREGDAYHPSLSVATRGFEGRVEIRVRDNGGGIPLAVRDEVFSPFFTTKAPGEGTGLGLSISHDVVVQGHGGTMTLETEDGRGTEVTVSLPRTGL